MTKEQINVIEDILNTKFNNKDILGVHVGNRSQIYRINNNLNSAKNYNEANDFRLNLP